MSDTEKFLVRGHTEYYPLPQDFQYWEITAPRGYEVIGAITGILFDTRRVYEDGSIEERLQVCLPSTLLSLLREGSISGDEALVVQRALEAHKKYTQKDLQTPQFC